MSHDINFWLILITGIIATDMWRYIGGIFGASIDANSALFRWVKSVATGLVAALIAKLAFFSAGSLGEIPILFRLAALLLGIIIFFSTTKIINYNARLGISILISIIFLYQLNLGVIY